MPTELKEIEPSDLSPIHPGEVLREDWLVPLKKTAYWLAKGIGMSPTAVTEILNGKRSITANTALRLSRFLGTSPQVWLNLQAQYDLKHEEARLSSTLDRIRQYDAQTEAA
jgi:addiction module HigA family antidote